MKAYATINENFTCVGISELTETVNDPNMIEIPSYDESYIHKKYESGEWVDKSIEPTTPQLAPKTTEERLEEAKQRNLILMDAMATLYEEIQILKGV